MPAYIYIHIHMSICMYKQICMNVYIYLCIYLHIHMHIHTFSHFSVNLFVYADGVAAATESLSRISVLWTASRLMGLSKSSFCWAGNPTPKAQNSTKSLYNMVIGPKNLRYMRPQRLKVLVVGRTYTRPARKTIYKQRCINPATRSNYSHEPAGKGLAAQRLIVPYTPRCVHSVLGNPGLCCYLIS